jgi:hypothetical protein
MGVAPCVPSSTALSWRKRALSLTSGSPSGCVYAGDQSDQVESGLPVLPLRE